MNHCPEIRSSLRSVVGSSGTAAAEQIAKNVAEYIAHICTAEIKAAKTSGSAAALKSRMAKLIILPSLVRITQHRIGFRRLFKFCLCFLVPGIHIRMIFFGQLTVRFLQRILIRPSVHPEDFIIITLFSHICSPQHRNKAVERRHRTAVRLQQPRNFFSERNIRLLYSQHLPHRHHCCRLWFRLLHRLPDWVLPGRPDSAAYSHTSW